MRKAVFVVMLSLIVPAVFADEKTDLVASDLRTLSRIAALAAELNDSRQVMLAIVDNDVSLPGTEILVVWGEEGRGTMKPTVERHAQAEIRATVAPVPISSVAREAYRPKALA